MNLIDEKVEINNRPTNSIIISQLLGENRCMSETRCTSIILKSLDQEQCSAVYIITPG